MILASFPTTFPTAFPATTRTRSFANPSFRSFRSFDRAFAQLSGLSTTPSSGPAVSGTWVDGAYQLTVDLPGVAGDAVNVSVAGRTLTIDVATHTDATSPWTRQFRLPQTLDAEQVSARYVDGRLTVRVARTADPAVRQVAIDTSPVQPALESTALEGEPENGESTSITE